MYYVISCKIFNISIWRNNKNDKYLERSVVISNAENTMALMLGFFEVSLQKTKSFALKIRTYVVSFSRYLCECAMYEINNYYNSVINIESVVCGERMDDRL